MEIRDLVLLDGVRTPMAEFNGPFAGVSAIELGAHAARALFERTGVDPATVDHAIVGNAMQTSADAIYGARHVALKAGVPKEVPALTVNRLCGSGIQSIVSARAHDPRWAKRRPAWSAAWRTCRRPRYVVRGARKGLAARACGVRGLADGVAARHLLRLLHGADLEQPGARLRHLARGAGRLRGRQPSQGAGGDRGGSSRRGDRPGHGGRGQAGGHRRARRAPAARHHGRGAGEAARPSSARRASSPAATPRASSTARR